MGIVAQLIRDDLIQLHQFAENQEDLLSKLSTDLFEKAYVKSSFQQALLAREKEFPTGLQLENTAVAIPHTYSEHVIRPFIYINQLEKPISFIQMGTDDQEVAVHFVLVLGITDPQSQTGLLVELMDLFNNKSFLQKWLLSNVKEDIIHLFTENEK